MAKKAREAFRTISEVADWLDVPAHVLRFWESKFQQIKPVKRAGGRRYYRPNDMMLIGGIKALLHDDGETIRGVQKILKEEGIKHVAGLSQNIDTPADADAAKRRSEERLHRKELGETARRGKSVRAVQNIDEIEDAELADEPAEMEMAQQLAEVAEVAGIEAAEEFDAADPAPRADAPPQSSEPAEKPELVETAKLPDPTETIKTVEEPHATDAAQDPDETVTEQGQTETDKAETDDAETEDEDGEEEEQEAYTPDLFYVDLANNVVPLTPAHMAERTDVPDQAEDDEADVEPAAAQTANGTPVAAAQTDRPPASTHNEADLTSVPDTPAPSADDGLKPAANVVAVPADPEDSNVTLTHAQIKRLAIIAALRAVPREDNELEDSDLLGPRKRLLDLRERLAKALS